MRNFKKLIAMGTALAMAIIMNVSAFAAAGDTAEEPITDAYANGAVVVSAIKAALPTMTEGAQYTVVVVPVGEEISDSNIHYINQADGADAIWAEGTTWGTPEDLEDAEAGTYVVRVGDEAGHVDEIYFRVGSTQPPVDPPVDPKPETKEVTFVCGDVNGDNVSNNDDAIAILLAMIKGGSSFAGGEYDINEEIYTDIMCGDVNGDRVSNNDDAIAILLAMIKGGSSSAGGEYDINETVTLTITLN